MPTWPPTLLHRPPAPTAKIFRFSRFRHFADFAARAGPSDRPPGVVGDSLPPYPSGVRGERGWRHGPRRWQAGESVGVYVYVCVFASSISIFSLFFSPRTRGKRYIRYIRYTFRAIPPPQKWQPAATGRSPFKTGAGIKSAGGRKNNHARTCIRTTTSSVLFATFSPPSHFTLLNIVYTTRNTCNILHKEFSASAQLLSC